MEYFAVKGADSQYGGLAEFGVPVSRASVVRPVDHFVGFVLDPRCPTYMPRIAAPIAAPAARMGGVMFRRWWRASGYFANEAGNTLHASAARKVAVATTVLGIGPNQTLITRETQHGLAEKPLCIVMWNFPD